MMIKIKTKITTAGAEIDLCSDRLFGSYIQSAQSEVFNV